MVPSDSLPGTSHPSLMSSNRFLLNQCSQTLGATELLLPADECKGLAHLLHVPLYSASHTHAHTCTMILNIVVGKSNVHIEHSYSKRLF